MPGRRLTLEFDPKVTNNGEVQRLQQTISRLGQDTRLSAREFEILRDVLLQAGAAGRTAGQALRDITRNPGTPAIKAAAEQAAAAYEMEAKSAESAAKRIKVASADIERAQAQQLRAGMVLSRMAGVSVPGLSSVGGLSGSMLGGVAAAGAVIATAREVANLTSRLGEYAREQQNLASKTGMSTAETQMFGRIAQVTGVNTSVLTTGIRTLSKAMAENSDEGRKGKQALKEIGLDAAVAFEAPGRAISQIMSGLSGLDNAWDRERVAITLFGRSGLEILPLVDNYKALGDQVHNTGVILDQDGINKAAEYKRKLELLGLEWTALKNKLGEKIIGLIDVALTTSVTTGKRTDENGKAEGGKTVSTTRQLFGGNSADRHFLFEDDPFRSRLGVGQVVNPQVYDPKALLRKAKSDQINGIIRSGESKLGRSEALHFDLKDAESDLAVAKDKLDVGGVQAANNKVLKIKQQIKALGGGENAFRTALRQTEREEQQAALAGFGRVGAIEARRRFELQDISENPKLTAAQKANLSKRKDFLFGQELAVAASEEGDKNLRLRTEFEHADLMENRKRQKDRAEESLRFIHGTVTEANKGFAADREIANINLSSDKSGIERQFGRAQQISSLQNSGPGQQTQAIQAAYSLRIQLAQKLLDIELKRAAIEGDDDKQRVDVARAYADLRKEQQEAELEREMKLLELAKQRKDEFKSIAIGFVNAAESHSLPSFFKQQGQKLQDTIVGNAAGMLFNTPTFQKTIGSVGIAKPGTFLGDLLKGTLGVKGSAQDVPIERNTDSHDRNTAALNRFTGVLTGQSPTGVNIPGVATVSALAGLLTTGAASGSTNGKFAASIPTFFGGTGVDLSGSRGGSSPMGSIQGAFSNFASGIGAVAAGKGFSTLFGSGSSTGERVGSAVGIAGAVGGAISGVKEITQGGGRNVIGGIGDTAMAIAPLTGPAAPFVEAAGLLLKGVSLLISDPKADRLAQINHELTNSAYSTQGYFDAKGNFVAGRENKSISYFGSSNGDSFDYSYRGGLRDGSAAATSRNTFDPSPNANQIGYANSGSPPKNTAPQVIVQVLAMDHQSFMSHSNEIADALRKSIQAGHPVVSEMQQTLQP